MTLPLDKVDSSTSLAEVLAVAFTNAGMREICLPVKNTFINFDVDESPISSPTGLPRSFSCPPCFPLPASLADRACWEGATQVLCHSMPLRQEVRSERQSPKPSEVATPQEGRSSAEASTFASPASSSSCSRSPTSHFSERAFAGECSHTVARGETTQEPKAVGRRPVALIDKQGSISEVDPASPSHGWQNKTRYFQKCEVGIADDNTFRVVRRLLGPAGENLKHIIERANGAKVWICGQGSRHFQGSRGNDSGPLSICISATTQASLEKATELVQDLLQSTNEDYCSFWTHPSSAMDATAAVPESEVCGSFKVGIEEDSDFQVVKRIMGKSGKNLKRIEADTAAKVHLHGRKTQKCPQVSGELEVHVSASSQESFDVAAACMMTLLTRIHADYCEFCSQQGKPAPVLAVVCQAVLD